jgi:hypothetical protein
MSLSFIYLASLFFLPCCLPSSCPPPQNQPSEVPCKKSIKIKPPFIILDDASHLCEDAINIKCGHYDKSPRVYLFHSDNIWFSLENITYEQDNGSKNKLVVRDPALEKNLNSSSCGNLQFSFLTPSDDQFDYDQFLSFSTNVKSFCGSPNLSSQRPILSREYTLNYSTTTDKYLPETCYRNASNASFEWTFSFKDHGSLILLSAQYSYNILPQRKCFRQSIVGGNSNGL